MRYLLLWFLILLPGLGTAQPLRVFVSVLPQKALVEKVGGRHAEVHAMVRPGHNPHTYDPTPQQIAALSNADLYVRCGVPFELAWMERIRSANARMQVLDAREGIELRDFGDNNRDYERPGDRGTNGNHRGQAAEARLDKQHHEAGARDPHVWTSPALVKRMAGRIRDKLTELDPGNTRDYARNHDVFTAELDALDRSIRSLLEDVPTRSFMVFHPAWGYFADAFGLIQVPIEKGGKEPGPRALTSLIEQAKRDKVKVIFVQPQFSKKSAEQVARAIGGRVVAIDPLAANFVDNLRNVARQISEAAKQ